MYCQFLSKEVVPKKKKEVVPVFTAISNVQWCAFYHIKKKLTKIQIQIWQDCGSSLHALPTHPEQPPKLSLKQAGLSFVLLHFLMAQTVRSLPAIPETRAQSLGWEDPLEKEMATHCSILAWKNPMDGRAWQAPVHGVTKSRTGLSGPTLTCNSP